VKRPQGHSHMNAPQPQLLDPHGRPTASVPRVARFARSGWRRLVAVAGGIAVLAGALTNIETIKKLVLGDAQLPHNKGSETADSRYREVRELIASLGSASTVSAQEAAITRFSTLWEEARDSDLAMMVNALAGHLESDSQRIRLAVAEQLGTSRDHVKSQVRRDALKRLLYGNRHPEWWPGVLTERNRHLKKRGIPDNLLSLNATIRGIRRGWRDLRGTHLDRTFLRGGLFYEANLENASLSDADLSCADLRGARLDGALVQGVQWKGANLFRASADPAVLEAARRGGAVEMDLESWRASPPVACRDIVNTPDQP
jgi:hypothetical protein